MAAVAPGALWSVGALAFSTIGILLQIYKIYRFPQRPDLSRPKGDPHGGVVYAFTLGMAPWAKESTRRHGLGYGRGVLFHLGVFAAIITLLLELFSPASLAAGQGILAAAVIMGLLCGVAGLIIRLSDSNLRAISNGDDYLALLLTLLFMGGALFALLLPAATVYLNYIAAITFVYLPFSKIRHLIYFFFTRYFFGAGFGRRGVLKQHP